MSETALTTQAEQSLLKLARSKTGTARIPLPPSIKMINHKGEIEGMEYGEYYIETQEKDDNNEYQKVRKSIGTNPEVILLLRLYTYAMYSETENKPFYWTNEFSDFKAMVYLINNTIEQQYLQFSGSYPDFKKYKVENFTDKKGKSELKFKNVFYVSYENSIYRSFVSNASITGIPSGEKHGDYKEPQAGSFLKFEESLETTDDGFRQAFLEVNCKLGSLKVEGEDYYLMTFENAGENKNLKANLKLFDEADKFVVLRTQAEFASLNTDPLSKDEGLPPLPQPSISAADLPF